MPTELAKPDPSWGQTALSLIGGGPSAAEFVDPQAANYTIGGMDKYQNDMQNIAGNAYANPGLRLQGSAAGLLGQTAQGQGPSLAREMLSSNLGNINSAIQAQSMANQGNIGAGVAQRNMLNAQAAAANSAMAQARQASVAEQLGAMGQYANAAQALTQGHYNANQQAGTAYQGQLGANMAQTNNNMAYDQAALNQANLRAGADVKNYSNFQDKAMDTVGSILGFGGK